MLSPVRLEVEDLAVERGGVRVFSGVSFRAGPGEYVEVTGPNGAGKTSLLRAIAGLLKPAEGRATVSSNLGPMDAEDRAGMLHLMGHRDGLKASLPVSEHVAFWEGLYGGADGAAALAHMGLAHLAERPARTLSAGQARRLALSRLLIAPRPLWLLDEPAAALDVEGRARLLGLVGDHLAAGGIVVAALHDSLGPYEPVRVRLPGRETAEYAA